VGWNYSTERPAKHALRAVLTVFLQFTSSAGILSASPGRLALGLGSETGSVNDSVLGQLLHGTQQILSLRQDGIFQNRLVCDKHIFGRDTTHRSVEVIE
jgi:hypothetical protein